MPKKNCSWNKVVRVFLGAGPKGLFNCWTSPKNLLLIKSNSLELAARFWVEVLQETYHRCKNIF